MEYEECEIGQRVVATRDADNGEYKTTGISGIIRSKDDGKLGIEFDKDVNGHDGKTRFRCKYGYGLFVYPRIIELLEKEITEEIAEKVTVKSPYSEWEWDKIKEECKNRGINPVGKKKEIIYKLLDKWDEDVMKGIMPEIIKSPKDTVKEEIKVNFETVVTKSETPNMLQELKSFLTKFREDEKLFNEIKQIVNEKE